MEQHKTRRKCPGCEGHFFLNGGVARCPHCNITVSVENPTRRRQQTSSSMRAATTSGYIFVGSAQHGSGQPSEEKYHVKAVKPDKAAAEERQTYRNALAGKRKFWEEELAWILEEFGPEAIRWL